MVVGQPYGRMSCFCVPLPPGRGILFLLFLISSRQRIQMGGGEGGSCFLSFVANGCRCDDLVFLRLSHPSRARALQVSGRHRDPITIPPVPKASVNLGV